MGKIGYWALGALIGVAAGLIVDYLLGPASDSAFDETYRTRLDRALEEGERAADAREAELRRQFLLAKQPSSSNGAHQAGALS